MNDKKVIYFPLRYNNNDFGEKDNKYSFFFTFQYF